MSMITRCPNCSTTFRVQPQQLQARNGTVRCGQCAHVFDGFKTLDTLADVATPTAQPAVEPPVVAPAEQPPPAPQVTPPIGEPAAAAAFEPIPPLETLPGNYAGASVSLSRIRYSLSHRPRTSVGGRWAGASV